MGFHAQPRNGDWPTFTSDEFLEIGKYFDAGELLDCGRYIAIFEALVNTEPRPLFVGGKLAVFLEIGDGEPFGCGAAFGQRVIYSEIGGVSLANKTAHNELCSFGGVFPSPSTFGFLFDLVPDALYISMINGDLLFELPEVQQNEHYQRLQWIPNRISGRIVRVLNGVVELDKYSRRQKAPDPRRLVPDVCNHGELSPGVMLTGYAEDKTYLTSAGVLLSKKGEHRLTVAGHGFGPDSPLIYNPDQDGGLVGEVEHRFRDSDIALAKLNDTTVYTNSPYFEVPTPLTCLLKSSEIEEGQLLAVDTFATGLQVLECRGLRAVRRSRGEFPGRPDPDIQILHGIYATNAEFITCSPQIRDGMYGTLIVVLKKKRESDLGVVGGVTGFLCCTNIPGYSRSLLCYAETCDDLLKEGWSLA